TGREADEPRRRLGRITQRAGGVRKGRKRGPRRGRTHERPARNVCNHGVAPLSGTPLQKPAAPASFRSCPRNAEGIIAAFQFAELRNVRGQLKDKATPFPLEM